ncbi:glycerol acyltransferase [Bacteroidia bacterium]|nr:glycerol acyltransferase [Bacteroidia bacterium]
MEQEIQQIDLDAIIKGKAPKLYQILPRFVLNWLKKLIHQEEINDVIRRLGHLYGVDFAKALIADFNINIEVEGLDNLPEAEHLCTFASNHPLGGLDGVALAAVLGDRYPNVKLVVNDVLMNLVNLAPVFVPINKYGSQGKDSAGTLNEAYDSDAQMVVFPAGMVSRKQKGEIKDLVWKKNFIVKTIRFQRDVVPVLFQGKNSKRFYRVAKWRKWFGLPNIELILLPDELFKNKNATFRITFGKPISWEIFDESASRTEWADYVKNIVYEL